MPDKIDTVINQVTKLTQQLTQFTSIMTDVQQKVSKLTCELEKELLTPAEVCKILKINRNTYQRYVNSNVLEQVKPISKNNSKAYVKRSELNRLIEEGKI